MTVQRVNSPDHSTEIDLQHRGAVDAVSTVSVRASRSGHWTVVEVVGEMDLLVRPLVADLVGNDVPRVVFDLPKVTFMDAAGLGLMVDTHRRALEVGGCVRLVSPASSVRRVLRLTGYDRRFLTFDSLDLAVSTPIDADLEPAS